MYRYTTSCGIVALTVALSGTARAECRIPEPDGGEEHPSPANISGRITKVAGTDVLIRQAGTGRIVRVHLPARSSIYTVFGGDGPISELAVGQEAKVWFQACTWPKTGTPVSAYFQIYSKAPNDRP